MASKDSAQPAPGKNCLISFPSVSSALHTLPNATNLKSVNIHPNMYSHRAVESEAKLQRALARTPTGLTAPALQAVNYSATSGQSSSATSASPDSDPMGAPLMMRTKSKFSYA